MSTYELDINGSGAEAGAERIVKSFDSIRAAATRMEGGVVAAANKMVSAFSSLSNIKGVSQQAVGRLRELSDAMGKFRGPSRTSVQNTVDLFTSLSRFSNLRLPSTVGLANFLNATNRYAGPTPQAGKNLSSLVNALNKFNGVTGAGARVTAFLSALGSYRGPSASAGKNVTSLFSALSNFKGLPRGFASSSEAFVKFAAAVDRAAASMRGLKAESNFKVPSPVAPSGRGGRGGGGGGLGGQSSAVRGLTREYGLLETAVFRTHSAMNALGGVLAAKYIIGAANDLLKIRAQLIAATGSAAQAGVQFEYLQKISNKLGLDLRSTAQSYGKFLGSVKGTKTDILQAQQIFDGFATAGRALQLSTDDMDGIFRALGQIMSKGKLQAEELRGQLGDRLPGAFSRMAAALGMSTQELDAAMKKGLISGKKLQDGLLNMADMLKTEFTDSAEIASRTVDAAFNRMKNAFLQAAGGLGKSGLNEGLIAISDAITKFIQSDALAAFLSVVGMAFKVLGDNANTFGAILAGVLVASTLKWAASLKSLLGMTGPLNDFFKNAGTAFNSGYSKGSGLVSGVPSATASATAAAGAAAQAAAGGMNAYATSAAAAATASTEEALAAASAAAETGAAGTAATISATGFDAQAAAALRSGAAIKLAAAEAATANAAASGLTGTVKASVPALGQQAAQFKAAGSAVTSYGGTLSGLANTTKAATSTISASWTNQIPSQAKFAASTSQLANSLKNVGTAAAVNAAPLGNLGSAAAGLATTSTVAATGVAGLSTAAGGAARTAGALGTSLTGAAVAGADAAASTRILTGSANGLTAAGTVTTTVVQGLAVAETEAAAAAVTQGLATRALAGIMGYAAGALAVFRMALMTLPLVAVAVGVASLISYMSSLKSKSDEVREAMSGVSDTESTGAQIAADYADWVEHATGKLDDQTRALREHTAAKINDNLAMAGSLEYGFGVRTVKAGPDYAAPKSTYYAAMAALRGEATPGKTYARGGLVLSAGGQDLPSDITRQLLALGEVKNGKFTSRGAPRNEAEYRRLVETVNKLSLAAANDASIKGNTEAQTLIGTAVGDAQNIANLTAKAARFGTDLGYDPNAVNKEYQDKYHKKIVQDPDPVAKPKKGKTGDGGAAAALNQDEQDLRRAMETVRDLNREIGGADAAIASLRSAGGTAVASEAQNAAIAQLNNIEDAFNTAGRGREGIMKFTARLREDATAVSDAVDLVEKATANPASVTDNAKLQAAVELTKGLSEEQIDAAKRLKAANVDTFESSKQATLDYLTTLQQLKAERQKELDLTKQIADAQIDVASKTGGTIPGTTVTGVARKGVDLVAATREGGRALQEATLKQEAITQAVGVSAAEYDNYVDKLYKAKLAQAELNVQLEQAAKLHDQAAEKAALLDTANLYQQGGTQRDIEAQQNINAMQRDLVDKGWSNEMINGVIAQEKELANLRARVDDVRTAYEQLQQVSQDLSDAIVGGFRDAMEGTKSFGDALGDVFKQMKKIILDFVLYNPLKNFLQQTLQSALGQGGLYTAPTASSAASLVSVGGTGNAPPPSGSTAFFSVAAGALTDAFSTGIDRMSTSVGTSITNAFDPSTGNVAPVASAGAPAASSAAMRGGLDNFAGITVSKTLGRQQPLLSPALNLAQPDFLAPLKAIFTWKRPVLGADGKPQTDPNTGAVKMLSNFGKLKEGFSDIGAAFGGSVKGFGAKLGKLGQGLGKVAAVAGQAFAAFSIGKGLGDALGMGHVGSSVLGGAAAGFSVAGPIGGVIGGIAGLIGGLFSNKKPQARADVLVSQTGQITAGNQYVKDKGDLAGTVALAGQAGGLFQKVADSLDAVLKPGNYGTFGMAKKIKGDVKTFYSLTGQVDSKGRPKGTEGVDFKIAGPDELAAFALKNQILKDKFGNLNPIYKTIAQNSTANTGDALASDLQVGKQYLDFIDQAKGYNQVEKAAKDLTTAYNSLKRASASLGVDTARLTKAYEHMQRVQKEDFNFSVNQGILGIKDPLMAEYNQLVKDYTDAVKSANAVGGDLTKVEEYFGLQRAQLVKKYMEQANNSIKNAANDLLRQLTATDSSPLSAQTVYGNAQDQYNTLKNQIMSGDFTNVDKLGQYSQDLLSSAQNLFSSSTDFFAVFSQVTDFLKYVGANAPAGTGTDPGTLPDLPSLATIQQQIVDSNKDLVDATENNVDATNNVGAAILEGNGYLAAILAALRAQGITSTGNAAIDSALLARTGSLSTLQKVG